MLSHEPLEALKPRQAFLRVAIVLVNHAPDSASHYFKNEYVYFTTNRCSRSSTGLPAAKLLN
jgi:hypothetical protein